MTSVGLFDDALVVGRAKVFQELGEPRLLFCLYVLQSSRRRYTTMGEDRIRLPAGILGLRLEFSFVELAPFGEVGDQTEIPLREEQLLVLPVPSSPLRFVVHLNLATRSRIP